jgi:hypothetical protein
MTLVRAIRSVVLALGALGLVLLAACGGRQVLLPSPSATSTSEAPSPTVTPTPTASATETAAPTPELDLPRDAPTVLAERVDAGYLAQEGYAWLLPPNAGVLGARTSEGTLTQVAVAWYRGEDPFARESGLVIWQRFPDPPAWRAVFAATNRPSHGILGIALEQEDLTDDGLPDLLVREDMGGTGACARWRVLVSRPGGAAEAWRHEGCDTTVEVSRGRLLVREAIFRPDDPHCCPSSFRLRTLAFDGTTFVETRARTIDAEP